ncbi:MAG: UDP-N-acetylglucosamine 2-epimerase (non-hydrolyzing) [Thermomonas sp.]
MHDILFISGTRPEIIKLAPLYHQILGRTGLHPTWLHTGQHGEMASTMHSCFDIDPEISFKRDGNSLCEFSTNCRLQLEAVMLERKPDMVIVQGDTESAFLGALAGFYHHAPVAHVEAGLRTHDLDRPFPEEGLRQMIGRVSQFHFSPTAHARDMLLAEGIRDDRIFVTGNTVVDAQRLAISRHGISRNVTGRGRLLVTTHRRENWGNDLENICHAVAAFAKRHPALTVLFPVHLNPVVQGPVHTILRGLSNVRLTSPLDYLEMQQALADAWVVLTDSGGLQEEAPTFGVPLLVLRNETERPEAVEAGCARIVGTDFERILAMLEELWSDDLVYRRMQKAENPFGDGHASERIASRIEAAMGTVQSQRAAVL